MLRPLLANINEDALMLLKDGPMLSGMQKLCQSQSNSQEDVARAPASGRKYGEVLCR